MMKKETLEKKIRRIEQELSCIERGLTSDDRIFRVCDSIEWLIKFRHVDEETGDRLCDRASEVMEIRSKARQLTRR